MIRRILQLLIVLICLSFQTVFADVVKVNDITFDSSDSVIFVSTSGSDGNIQVRKGVLTNPDRIFIDIDNAVLTRKQGLFEFSNGKLSSLKISQFSTSPNTVRIVMNYTNKLRPQDLKIMSLGGNIIIKLQNYKPSQDYLTPIYREVKSSAYDYYEKVRITEAEIIPPAEANQVVLTPAEPNKNGVVQPNQKIVLQNEPVRVNPPVQESKLRSRFFVSDIFVKQESLLIAGTGIVNLEKVFYLSNPSRVVFDIPNTVSSTKIRTKTFKISENETAKVGQFEPTKVRVVITTPEPKKYVAIYSNDLQNILIAREDKIRGIKLFSNSSDILSSKVTSKNEYRNNVSTLNIDFSEPVVHSLKRNGNSLEWNLYNINLNNTSGLAKSLKNGNFKNSVIEKLGNTGIKIIIPITESSTLDCLENLQATKLVLTVKSPIPVQTTKKNLNKRIIVIDAGHGGSDPGAMRENVMEKNITLNIAKLVEEKLKQQGATVYMSRNDDTFVSLSDRVLFSNNRKPDIFVSIHINASEKEEVNGIETHYFKDDSFEFSKYMHKSLISKINDKDRGIFKSRFYVIRNTEAPAVLLELGFISNEEERTFMQTKEKQEAFADAITEGIINYFNNIGSEK